MKKFSSLILSMIMWSTLGSATQITTNGIANGAITNAKINSSATIALNKLATLSASKVLQSDGSGFITASGVTTTTLSFLDATSSIQTQINGKQATGNYVTALTGDVTASGPGSVAATLATVNSNVGSFGSSTSIPSITVNAKGLVTAASGNSVIAPAGTLSGTTLNSTVVSSSLTSLGTIATGVWNGTTIAVANGGTGQTSYTDGQLLIGNTSGNTLTKATLTAGTNITITNGNGSITVASASFASPAYNFTSQSTTYSAAVNDWVFASGASFTITLPTAVGNSGKMIVIQHNGTSLTQVYTLNTTSGQTIGGVASGSYALYTAGEVLVVASDNSNWQIISHRAETDWIDGGNITFTGTTTNPTKGTVSLDKIWWRRIGGNSVELRYEYKQTATGGAIGSGDYKLSMPANITADTTKITVNATVPAGNAVRSGICGVGDLVLSGSQSATGHTEIFDSTHVRIVAYNGSSYSSIGSTFFALNNAISYNGTCTLPVSNWEP